VKVFTDDEMNAQLASTRPYSVAILRAGANFVTDRSQRISWEGRRNFGLRDDGMLSIVLPVADGSGVCGICVFTATVEQTAAIMRDDPGWPPACSPWTCTRALGFPGTRCRSAGAKGVVRCGLWWRVRG
jgi:hypothetical protein